MKYIQSKYETSRLFFYQVMISDADDMFNGYSNSYNATRYLNLERHGNIKDTISYVKWCINSAANRTGFLYSLRSKETNEYIGNVSIKVDIPKAEGRYTICEKFQNKGYATEAAKFMVDELLQFNEIYRIYATYHLDNKSSERVMNKIGLTYEATMRNWNYYQQCHEKAGSVLLYSKLK